MFERHDEGVCNTLCHQQSNGKIQKIKIVRGDTENLKASDPPSSFCGGLDTDPQQCR